MVVRGRHHTEEAKRKIREGNRGKHLVKRGSSKVLRPCLTCQTLTINAKFCCKTCMGKNLKWREGQRVSKVGKSHSNNHTQHWLRSNHQKPTKPELHLLELIQKNNLPYVYTGNGEVILGGSCPDFINTTERKQLIELYGCYWHRCPKCGFEDRGNRRMKDKNRVQNYAQLGYETIVVWGHELRNEDEVLRRLDVT